MALSAKGIVLVPRKSINENEDKDGLIWQPSASRMSMFRRTSQYRDRQSVLRASRLQIPRDSIKKTSQELKEPCTITVSIVPKLNDHVKNFRKVLKELVSQGMIITGDKLSYDHQGNLAFYSKKNLRKRRQLEKHSTLCRLTRRFWASVVPHSMPMMEYENYENLYLRIHKILMHRFDIRHAIISIQEDWHRDTNGQEGGLSYEKFHLSLFELIGIVDKKIEASDYIELLCLILDGIVHVKEDSAELKPLQDVEYKDVRKRTTSSEVQLFLDNPKAVAQHTSASTSRTKTSPVKPNHTTSSTKIPRQSNRVEPPKATSPRAPNRPTSAPISRQMSKSIPKENPKNTTSTPKLPPKQPVPVTPTPIIRPTSPPKSPIKSTSSTTSSPNKLQRQQKPQTTESNNPPSGENTPEAEVTSPPLKPTSPKLIRPRSSPLKRSPPSPTSTQPVHCEDTNFHAIRTTNYDFDPNKVGLSVGHFPKIIRPGFQLVLQPPLSQEDSDFFLDIEGHNVPLNPVKARLRKTPPPSPPKALTEPNSINLTFDTPRVEPTQPSIVPLKGAILYSAPSIPMEEEWVKRSHARATKMTTRTNLKRLKSLEDVRAAQDENPSITQQIVLATGITPAKLVRQASLNIRHAVANVDRLSSLEEIPSNEFSRECNSMSKFTRHELTQPTTVEATSVVPKLFDRVKSLRRVIEQLVADGNLVTDDPNTYMRQGSLAFYTDKNLFRRIELQHDATLCQLTKLLWNAVVPSHQTMDKKSHKSLFLRIHKALIELFDIKASTIKIEEDWFRDTNDETDYLTYEMFHLSVFELIGMLMKLFFSKSCLNRSMV
ncbi:hypothetical protein THRCLA_01014 [Thraustotheca clavata]|uniref:Uncharacterized protein n=1 Tax=Thraustotheca clavata TaxID=74557 RepID=A0A1W0A9P8_9STRA|nr:hypothetical protein THRCLA_01014 [Thraustotheca clavata]